MKNTPPPPDTQDNINWHEDERPNFGTLLLIVPASWLLMTIVAVIVWWMA